MTGRTALESWVQSQSGFPECLRAEDLEYCRQKRLDYLGSGNSPTIVQAGDLFVAWDAKCLERDTGKPLAMLWATNSPNEKFQELLIQSAQELDPLPLVASAFTQQLDQMNALQQSGFYPLRHFVTKSMGRQSVNFPYQMREGAENDRPFFSALAVSVASHTLPPNRQSDLGAYNRILVKSLLKLDYTRDSENRLLIAEDEDGERVGYLLLRTDERKTAWVVDIGVSKSHWGKGVAQFLVLSAENQLIEEGYQFYVGEISAANKRSLWVSTKLCGFSPNRQLWRRDPGTD